LRIEKKLRQNLLLLLALNALIYQSLLAQPNFSKKNNLGLSLGISNYHNTEANIAAGRDRVLEFAINYLN